MSQEQIAHLEQQVQALQVENQQLLQQLDQIRQRGEAVAEARTQAVLGGGRLLIPLLDRQKVVRSFGKLAGTMSQFAGPMDGWPARDQVLGDSRVFLESCVRFVIRRRLFLLLFSLLAATIPAIQIWLVVQQNEIIQNQNALFEIQVHDVVSRSMTEGDRNAKLMTGALLSRADLGILRGVVDEAFNPDLAGVYGEKGVQARTRRLQDAAFRGYLARAVVRGVEVRVGTEDKRELYQFAQPMLGRILADAASRVPSVLRFGEGDGELDGELAEQVDNYLIQTGEVLVVYGRFARTIDDADAFHAEIAPLLRRVSDLAISGNRFEPAYRVAIETLVFEEGLGLVLEDPPLDFANAELTPEQARAKGLERLESALGSDAVAWDKLAKQLEG